MAFRVGQAVGGYRFLRVLDAAGSAMTYEVENEVAGRREILKVLPSGFEADRNRIDRFLREARIHSQLSHPNIAEFYGGLQLDGRLVMTMEAVGGLSLQERINESALPIPEAIQIVCQALSALEYAHSHRIVHREITPATVYIRSDGIVKLTGLGLAKREHDPDPALTQIGAVIGEVHYMSPEQVRGQQDIDGRSDVYAVGIVLYEAVTGRKPFDSRSQFEIIQAQVMQAPQPPNELSGLVSEELSQVILKALEKDRENRYPTAGAFRTALDQLAAPELQRGRENDLGEETSPDIEKLARNLEFERGPSPIRRPAAVLQLQEAQEKGGSSRTRKRLPVWTQVGPAALDELKQSPSRAGDADPVASLWGLQGWTKRDLTLITVLAFVMSAAAVVALIVWLGL